MQLSAPRSRVFLVAVLLSVLLSYLAVSLTAAGQWISVDDYDDFEEDIEKDISCPQPTQIANAETIVWGEGMLLEYRCKAGYSPVGITHGACDLRTGTWTIEPPVCTDLISKPILPSPVKC